MSFLSLPPRAREQSSLTTVHFVAPALHRLSNDKPSAIFRLKGTFAPQSTNAHAVFTDAFSGGSVDAGVTAQVGIAIEPLDRIAEQLAGQQGALANPADTRAATLMAERVVRNLFNYLSSFVDGNPAAISPDVMVPMGMIAKWYENFVVKIRNQGVGFLERQE